jgi:tetratricopeptide (TPR) repeat protein
MKQQMILLYGLFCVVVVTFFLSSCSTKEKKMPITTSSDEAKQLFIQARDDFENMEFPKASKLFEKAITKDSTFALAYLYKAFSGSGGDDLRKNLEKAVLLSQNISEGEQLLIKTDKAYNLDKDKKLGKEYSEKLLQMYPEDKRVYFYHGWEFINDGESDSGIVYLKRAVELDASYAAPHNFLGYAYMNNGDNEQAEKEFKEYVRLAPERPNPYDSYGECLLKVGKYNESIANYAKSYELDNSFVSSFYRIGDGYLFKGDYVNARENYQKYFDKSESIDSKLSALRMKARSFLYENKLNEALKSFSDYRTFAEKEKKSKEVVMAYSYEGFALSEFGKTAEGLKKYQESVALIGKVNLTKEEKETLTRNSFMYLTYAFAMDNQLDKAKGNASLYKKAIESKNDPAEKENLDWLLGFIEYKEGKYDSMIEKFKKQSGNDVHGKYYMSQAYLKIGDKKSAKKLLNEILNFNENSMYLAVVWNKAKQELAKL